MKIPSLMELFRDHDDAPQWMREKSPRRRPRPAKPFKPMVAEVLELRSTPSAIHAFDPGRFETAQSATAVGHDHAHTHANSFGGTTSATDLTIVDAQGTDSLPPGCCEAQNTSVPSGTTSTNPPVTGGSGIIVGSDGSGTPFGNLADETKGKKLDPITGNNWLKLGNQSNCAVVVIQIPGGGFGVYHLGSTDAGKQGLDDFLKQMKTMLGGQAPTCLRIIKGSGGEPQTGQNCAALTKELTDPKTGLVKTIPDNCIKPAPKVPNKKNPTGDPNLPGKSEDVWFDPNGDIHYSPPTSGKE